MLGRRESIKNRSGCTVELQTKVREDFTITLCLLPHSQFRVWAIGTKIITPGKIFANLCLKLYWAASSLARRYGWSDGSDGDVPLVQVLDKLGPTYNFPLLSHQLRNVYNEIKPTLNTPLTINMRTRWKGRLSVFMELSFFYEIEKLCWLLAV